MPQNPGPAETPSHLAPGSNPESLPLPVIQHSLAPSCPLTGLCLGTVGGNSFPWGLAFFSESHWPLPAQVYSVSILTVGSVIGQECRKANYKLIRKCQPSKTMLYPIKSSFLLPCAPSGELGGLGLWGHHSLPLGAPPQSRFAEPLPPVGFAHFFYLPGPWRHVHL